MGPPSASAAARPRAGQVALIALVVVALALVLGPARPAAAHAVLQSTDPVGESVVAEVPDEVTLTFDEPVTATTGAVQVIAPSGSRVDGAVESLDGGRGVSVAVDGDTIGTYTVAFRVVSDDGHTISGSFVFHVETRTGAAEVDQSIPLATSATGGVGRWLSYAGAIVAVGAALLLLMTRSSGGPGPAVTRLRILVVAGAVAAAVGGGLAILAQTALTTGRSVPSALGLVTEVASDSRPVAVALARAGIMAVGAGVALVAGRSTRGLVAGAGVVALGSLLAPVAGHPWTADPRALAVTADAVHLLSASVWMGLLVALVVSARQLPDPLAAVRAVSRSALIASLVLLATGTISAWLLLGSFDALLHTASGQLVILKVIGFAALVTLGWINRTRLIPLLGRAVGVETSGPPAGVLVAAGAGADTAVDGEAEVAGSTGPGDDGGDHLPTPSGDTGERGALGRLVQVVRVEVVVGALVLAVTAALVNQPPGRDVLAQPYSATETVDGSTMLLEVEPAQAGTNEVHIYVTDATGNPAPVDALEVSAGRDAVPARKLAVEQISPDHAVAYGVSLPTPGTWDLDVTTVRVGVPRQFRFEVPVT